MNSSLVQGSCHKLSCQVPRVLNFKLDDCLPHNNVHDILHYSNYYSALFCPEYFPEVFATPSSKTQEFKSVWLFYSEVALVSTYNF